MFGKQIHLFTIFGFKVGIDFTWFFLAILVAWSLAAGLFPGILPGPFDSHVLVDGGGRCGGPVSFHRVP